MQKSNIHKDQSPTFGTVGEEIKNSVSLTYDLSQYLFCWLLINLQLKGTRAINLLSSVVVIIGQGKRCHGSCPPPRYWVTGSATWRIVSASFRVNFIYNVNAHSLEEIDTKRYISTVVFSE